jgi:hypothetical protein
MNKIIFTFGVIAILFVKSADHVSADVSVVSSSAELNYLITFDYSVDPRVIRLKNYLEGHNSPLSEHAQNFVESADRYDLDWRLVPAITGVESTFGKRIPYNSYNAYGWANGEYRFTSWDESIDHVSRSLREKYYDRGAENINKIARRYAPPSSSWSWKVKFFMEKIDSVPVEFDL